MQRRIIGLFVGFVVAIFLIMSFESVGDGMFPHGQVDPKDPKSIAAMMNHMPMAAFIWLLIGYAVSAFLGGLVATYISGRQRIYPTLIIGTALTVGGIMNTIMIPHPLWFTVANVFIYIPFAWLGYLSVRQK